jgi:fatty acid desaturase
MATLHQYRIVHQAHHQFTNDPTRDPDILVRGKSKQLHRFPMTKKDFVFHFFIKYFWPPVLLRYLWDVLYQSVLGQGKNPYRVKQVSPHSPKTGVMALSAPAQFRWTNLLGAGYLIFLIAGLATANYFHHGPALITIAAGGWLLAMTVAWFLPASQFFHSPFKQPYSSRATSMLRLTYYSAVLAMVAGLRFTTGINFGAYFWLLWVLPLLTTFPYYMMLRDVYQHANADDGKLTNSRVFFPDPFTRWAVFVYGQDLHLTHHLYPLVPHYRLLHLHRLLQRQNIEYRHYVVECHGTFSNNTGHPTILDVMETPTTEERAKAA